MPRKRVKKKIKQIKAKKRITPAEKAERMLASMRRLSKRINREIEKGEYDKVEDLYIKIREKRKSLMEYEKSYKKSGKKRSLERITEARKDAKHVLTAATSQYNIARNEKTPEGTRDSVKQLQKKAQELSDEMNNVLESVKSFRKKIDDDIKSCEFTELKHLKHGNFSRLERTIVRGQDKIIKSGSGTRIGKHRARHQLDQQLEKVINREVKSLEKKRKKLLLQYEKLQQESMKVQQQIGIAFKDSFDFEEPGKLRKNVLQSIADCEPNVQELGSSDTGRALAKINNNTSMAKIKENVRKQTEFKIEKKIKIDAIEEQEENNHSPVSQMAGFGGAFGGDEPEMPIDRKKETSNKVDRKPDHVVQTNHSNTSLPFDMDAFGGLKKQPVASTKKKDIVRQDRDKPRQKPLPSPKDTGLSSNQSSFQNVLQKWQNLESNPSQKNGMTTGFEDHKKRKPPKKPPKPKSLSSQKKTLPPKPPRKPSSRHRR